MSLWAKKSKGRSVSTFLALRLYFVFPAGNGFDGLSVSRGRYKIVSNRRVLEAQTRSFLHYEWKSTKWWRTALENVELQKEQYPDPRARRSTFYSDVFPAQVSLRDVLTWKECRWQNRRCATLAQGGVNLSLSYGNPSQPWVVESTLYLLPLLTEITIWRHDRQKSPRDIKLTNECYLSSTSIWQLILGYSDVL